ncbi:MAG: O-methyltransferase [Candidatus Dormibacteraeota bacterium]|uniref:Methyltransferase n=1 Tax=Candidatus Aeolococcus gillhamiae TaxID=3127015 RepID=A0A2W5ZNG5_9BACT|nr:O-methyltransferase [Candidatus Dormibacteraeota bacterium]PZR84376.1 MAG: methyltransferase [Candidatus Dormibacter sp. RRmetagenome_bin12]
MDDNAQEWTAVDAYLGELVLGRDLVLQQALDDAAAGGLPQIQVSPPQGRMLFLLANLARARTILEVGTLGGYSTICLARALPADGRLVTLEVDAHHAEVARANLARAGLDAVVEIRLGRALDSLREMEEERRGSFDLVFIDADKQNSADYFRWGITLGHPGTLIIVDNAVRHGTIIDAQDSSPDVVGTRAVLELMGADPRVTATVIQTVGSKGYDGFALAVVNDQLSPS